jgi:phage FluMu protein Com
MSIEFHCDHCSKLIRAPQEAAGHRGKCPYCQQSVYIPTPTQEIEEIPLAPVDTGEERERQRLERESRQAEREILADKRPPMDRAGPSAGPVESAMPADIPSGDDVEEMVIDYLLLMRNSELVQAESVLADLRKAKAEALQVINRLAADAVPPQALAGVPPGVYQGFLKNLRAQLR